MTSLRRSLRWQTALLTGALVGSLVFLQSIDRKQRSLADPVVPVRVHILHSTALPSVDCTLTTNDIRRIFSKANKIYSIFQQIQNPSALGNRLVACIIRSGNSRLPVT